MQIESAQKDREPRGSKVLVIDDDDVAREYMCDILRKAHFQVQDLRSPIGASRKISRENIDAVVLDVVMPTLRGDRLAKLLRGNPKFDKLGVVLVSGDVNVQLQKIAKELTAVAVVDKAKIRQDLVTAVNASLRVRLPDPYLEQNLG